MDKIHFFHGFDNIEKSLLKNRRVLYIGKGVGGQKDGFYLWNNKAQTVHFLEGKITTNPFICEVGVDKTKFSYPLFQFDYESLGLLDDRNEKEYLKQKKIINQMAELFIKYKDDVPSYNENLNKLGKGFEIICAKKTKYAPMIKCSITDNGYEKRASLYEGNKNTSKYEQILNDYMCENSKGYLEEYNLLLQESLNQQNIAVKYVGHTPLEVVAVYDRNGHDNSELSYKLLGETDKILGETDKPKLNPLMRAKLNSKISGR